MKLFHSADWHLGRLLYGRSLLEEQRHFIHHVFLPAVQTEKPDLVLLSGDLYDRQVAPPEAIALFDAALQGLLAAGCKVAMIAGNHDGAARIAILKNVLRRAGVLLATELADALSPECLTFGGEQVQLFLIPYLDCSVVRAHFQDESLRGEAACMKRILEELRPKFLPGHTHIALCHCFVAGAETSDSENVLFVGGAGQVPPALFADFDYVALGHLHRAQKAGKNGRYAGSPLKYSMDEIAHKKSFTQLQISGGTLDVTTIPVTPLHDFRRLCGPFAQLLEDGQASPCLDYVEIQLTDARPVLHAAEQLRVYYPNLLSIRQPLPVSPSATRRADLKTQTEPEIFSAFLQDICGKTPTTAQAERFAGFLKQTGGS